LAGDAKGGFWLIHSVPLFPDLGPPQFTWTASTIYGQSFLCVSLDHAGIDSAAATLQYMDPNIYASNIPTNLKSIYPQMTALYGGARQKGTNIVPFTSSGGTSFTHFSKDNTWGKDLYDDLVEPYFKMAFEWETWRRSPFLPSLCTTPYNTLNVASISLGNEQFSYTQDHSKWGVSIKGSYACIGGINRMQSQRARGGGTMCFADADFWKSLSGVVASTEPCSGAKSVSKTRKPTPVHASDSGGAPPRGHPAGHSGPGPRHHGAPSHDHHDHDHAQHGGNHGPGGKQHGGGGGKHGHGGGKGGKQFPPRPSPKLSSGVHP